MTSELKDIWIVDKLRDLKNDMQKSDKNFSIHKYYYALGLEVGQKFCEELNIKFGRKRKGHKLGKIFGMDVLYSPLIESDTAYILYNYDYEINMELDDITLNDIKQKQNQDIYYEYSIVIERLERIKQAHKSSQQTLPSFCMGYQEYQKDIESIDKAIQVIQTCVIDKVKE